MKYPKYKVGEEVILRIRNSLTKEFFLETATIQSRYFVNSQVDGNNGYWKYTSKTLTYNFVEEEIQGLVEDLQEYTIEEIIERKRLNKPRRFINEKIRITREAD